MTSASRAFPLTALSLSLALVLATAVWPARADGAPPGAMPSGMTAPHEPVGPADRAMSSGMAAMQEKMAAAPMTGDPDRDFVAMMEPHHQGAIDMARVELRYGKDPGLRRMSRDIIASQEREITEMRRWQANHPG